MTLEIDGAPVRDLLAEGAADPICLAGNESGGILIVEDEFLIALEIQDALTAAGFRVVGIAADAAAALRLAERTRPDLVLMDVRLNGPTDGVEAAVQIWRRFGIRSLFLTANPDSVASARAAAAKVAGVLAKPWHGRALVDAVCQALGRAPGAAAAVST